MAQVKLDISEYELMKEKSKLLEEALSREKELAKQLEVANSDRLDALKKNEKSVTIIKKTSSVQMLRTRKDPHELARSLNLKIEHIVHRVFSDIETNMSNHRNGGSMITRIRDTNFNNGFNIHKRRLVEVIDHYMLQYGYNPKSMIHLFFNDEETFEPEPTEEVYRVGLDQIKHEMREEALESLKSKSRKALEINPILEKEINDAKKELKVVSKRREIAETLNEKRDEEIKELIDKVSDTEKVGQENNAKLYRINLVVEPEISIFGNRKKLKIIKKILKESGRKN